MRSEHQAERRALVVQHVDGPAVYVGTRAELDRYEGDPDPRRVLVPVRRLPRGGRAS